MCPPGGPRNNPNQDALIQLAREQARRGVNQNDAQILLNWAREYGVEPAHIHPAHPNRNVNYPHIRVGPINHIPVR